MKKVLVFGVFDFLHIGHLNLFKQAKEHGDYLVVAVQDGDYILKYKPEAKLLYSTEERTEMLSALRIVDEVVVYRNLEDDIKNIDFDVYAMGEDHTADRFERAKSWAEAHGKTVVRLKYTQGISSTEIKKRLMG